MNEYRYLIGIDFGTSSTKVCIQKDESEIYFLPNLENGFIHDSNIFIKDDFKIDYVTSKSSNIISEHKYLKTHLIFEDKDLESKSTENPIFLSVIFLVNIYYRTFKFLNSIHKTTIIESDFFDEDKMSSEFDIRKDCKFVFGFPFKSFEYENEKIDSEPKYKNFLFVFQTSLKMFYRFFEKNLSYSDYLNLSIIELLDIFNLVSSKNDELIENISMQAETTAGIYYMWRVNSSGSFVLIDIGSGSCDISFINLSEDNGVKKGFYLNSESINSGTLELVELILHKNNNPLYSLNEKIKFDNIFIKNSNEDSLLDIEGYELTFKLYLKRIEEKLIKMFSKIIIDNQNNFEIKEQFKDSTAVILGGGSNLNFCDIDTLLIDDNGQPKGNESLWIKSKIRKVFEYFNEDKTRFKNIDENHSQFRLLCISLGLVLKEGGKYDVVIKTARDLYSQKKPESFKEEDDIDSNLKEILDRKPGDDLY